MFKTMNYKRKIQSFLWIYFCVTFPLLIYLAIDRFDNQIKSQIYMDIEKLKLRSNFIKDIKSNYVNCGGNKQITNGEYDLQFNSNIDI